MPTKTVSAKVSKTRFSVPISLNWGEKYVLDELSRESKLPLSTYIKSKLQPLIKPRLEKLSKTQILLGKIKTAKIDTKDIDLASKHGQEFRKKFKLIQD